MVLLDDKVGCSYWVIMPSGMFEYLWPAHLYGEVACDDGGLQAGPGLGDGPGGLGRRPGVAREPRGHQGENQVKHTLPALGQGLAGVRVAGSPLCSAPSGG